MENNIREEILIEEVVNSACDSADEIEDVIENEFVTLNTTYSEDAYLASKFPVTNKKKNNVDNPLDTMIGGTHYKQGKTQPIEYIHANNMSYIEGCIIKYITRYKYKNGREDLEKIKHYIDLLIKLEYDTEKN